MENEHFCESCGNKGWLRATVYGSQYIFDGTEIVGRCDECAIFSNDLEAASYAYRTENILYFQDKSGFNISFNFCAN